MGKCPIWGNFGWKTSNFGLFLGYLEWENVQFWVILGGKRPILGYFGGILSRKMSKFGVFWVEKSNFGLFWGYFEWENIQFGAYFGVLEVKMSNFGSPFWVKIHLKGI